jgi:UDP-N-acetylglucosamine 2-epimerase (non-hydrolysing)
LVVTLHRPANVDDPLRLVQILTVIEEEARGIPVVFPVHPRTAKTLGQIHRPMTGLVPVEPQPYLEFNYLVRHARGVITDSGGVTEETTVMGIPCMTMRDTTERPETVSVGTNELVGSDPEALRPALQRLLTGGWKRGGIPEKWDGRAGERIVGHLEELLGR